MGLGNGAQRSISKTVSTLRIWSS